MNNLRPLPPTMKSPRDRRPTVGWRNGVLQIWVTRACDKSCFGCTQGSNLGGKPGMMTVEQFHDACDSLDGYFGVVGMFGGNPCMHPHFDEMCSIMRAKVPYVQRGLWSNHLKGHGATCRTTFNPQYSNLNVHLDYEAAREMYMTWPEATQYVKGLDPAWPEAQGKPDWMVGDSRHSPVYVAMQDVIEDEEERWRLIGQCDINQNWSAIICVFRGELRGFFCEVAGAQAMLHQHEPDYPDLGVKIERGWWNKSMAAFDAQVRFHCHACGFPMRGYGSLAIGGDTEQVSKTHADVYKPKTKGRLVQLVDHREQVSEQALKRGTDYVQNGSV